MDKETEARALAIEALRTAPPVSLFASPLDYIFADHFRHRTLCRILDEIAEDAEPDLEKTAVALDFLTTDFGSHILDEEEDLFPLLRRRSTPEDDIKAILGRLSEEHANDKINAEEIVERLSAILSGADRKDTGSGFRDLLKRFTANERRHLTAENAIVLPFARARLNEDDLRKLGKHMAARRGLEYTERDHTV